MTFSRAALLAAIYIMEKDELLEEPKELKCEGEGVISGCEKEKSRGKSSGKKTDKRK